MFGVYDSDECSELLELAFVPLEMQVRLLGRYTRQELHKHTSFSRQPFYNLLSNHCASESRCACTLNISTLLLNCSTSCLKSLSSPSLLLLSPATMPVAVGRDLTFRSSTWKPFVICGLNLSVNGTIVDGPSGSCSATSLPICALVRILRCRRTNKTPKRRINPPSEPNVTPMITDTFNLVFDRVDRELPSGPSVPCGRLIPRSGKLCMGAELSVRLRRKRWKIKTSKPTLSKQPPLPD